MTLKKIFGKWYSWLPKEPNLTRFHSKTHTLKNCIHDNTSLVTSRSAFLFGAGVAASLYEARDNLKKQSKLFKQKALAIEKLSENSPLLKAFFAKRDIMDLSVIFFTQ